jgi:hypothetical protein
MQIPFEIPNSVRSNYRNRCEIPLMKPKNSLRTFEPALGDGFIEQETRSDWFLEVPDATSVRINSPAGPGAWRSQWWPASRR